MMPTIVTLLFAFALGLLPIGAWAQDDSDLQEMSLEELLGVEVVTASRYGQRLKDSPMSVTVLTADQVREAGARTIPEALRLVQGLEVMSPTTSSANVSARGVNELITNSILVLIDGRSVYQDFYGITFWSLLPISLADVQSIEIVRGPVSSLYGANAFSGVINIRTVPATEKPGTQVSASTGWDEHDLEGSVSHIDHWAGFDFRSSLAFTQASRSVTPDGAGSEIAKLNLKGERVFDSGQRLELAAGYSDGFSELIVSHYDPGGNIDGQNAYGRMNWSGGDWSLRGYWNGSSTKLHGDGLGNANFEANWREDVVDLEYQHSLELRSQHRLLLGGNVRYQGIDSDGGRRVQNRLVSAFANEEWSPGDSFVASVGIRADDHPVTGLQFSPRGSFLFGLGENHQLRAIAGSSFRNPTYAESYWKTHYEVISGLAIAIEGSEDLEAETIESYEVGLQSLWTSRLLTSVNAYHNRIRNQIDVETVETFPSPPLPVAGVPSLVKHTNRNSIDVTGVEWSLDYWMSDQLQWTLNGSVNHVVDPESNTVEDAVPRYRNSLGLRWDTGEHWLSNLWLRHVSETEWNYNRGLREFDDVVVGDYVVLDARVALRLTRETEFAVVARNLLDHEYQDYAAGHVFGARVLASLQTRF